MSPYTTLIEVILSTKIFDSILLSQGAPMSKPNDNALKSVLQLGFGSSILIVILEWAYAIVLALGLFALETASDPIGDPYFTIMEMLILAMMPLFVVLAIAVHAVCASHRKHFAMTAVVFAAILTAITSSVHTTILLLSREPAFAGMRHVFSFEWPSVAYALDILAWDFFFGIFAISAALSFEQSGLEGWVRRLLFLSGILALAGLLGAVLGDMNIRNVGIVGYVGVFTFAAGCLAVLMWRRMQFVG